MIDIHSKDLGKLLSQIKASAKRRNVPITLTNADLGHLTFPISCPVLGIPLKFNKGEPKDDSYSVDRIDNTEGYHINNIVIVSYRVNKLKSNATLEEMKAIVEFYNSL